MSAIHYYLSLIPQGLIASMLPPEQFGSYYALGSSTHARGEALVLARKYMLIAFFG